jgi:hypothetical protein
MERDAGRATFSKSNLGFKPSIRYFFKTLSRDFLQIILLQFRLDIYLNCLDLSCSLSFLKYHTIIITIRWCAVTPSAPRPRPSCRPCSGRAPRCTLPLLLLLRPLLRPLPRPLLPLPRCTQRACSVSRSRRRRAPIPRSPRSATISSHRSCASEWAMSRLFSLLSEFHARLFCM